ncbi:MAG: leucine-rich repeat domain-containing protein [Corynebacterium sp.]|nr:leucine-rich repeat domain-containing protein [Corynebacterium sp.]
MDALLSTGFLASADDWDPSGYDLVSFGGTTLIGETAPDDFTAGWQYAIGTVDDDGNITWDKQDVWEDPEGELTPGTVEGWTLAGFGEMYSGAAPSNYDELPAPGGAGESLPVSLVTGLPGETQVMESFDAVLDVDVDGSSPTTWKWETSSDGTSWTTVAEGADLYPYTLKNVRMASNGMKVRATISNGATTNPVVSETTLKVTPATPITMPDTALRQCIASELGIADNQINAEQLAKFGADSDDPSDSYLGCAAYGSTPTITDLTGISALTNMHKLSLVNNKVTDLTPLSEGLPKLSYLNLKDNPVSDISPLAGLTGLTEVESVGTHIVDFSPLPDSVTLNGQNQTVEAVAYEDTPFTPIIPKDKDDTVLDLTCDGSDINKNPGGAQPSQWSISLLGEYTCTWENTAGTVTGTYTITVEAFPTGTVKARYTDMLGRDIADSDVVVEDARIDTTYDANKFKNKTIEGYTYKEVSSKTLPITGTVPEGTDNPNNVVTFIYTPVVPTTTATAAPITTQVVATTTTTPVTTVTATTTPTVLATATATETTTPRVTVSATVTSEPEPVTATTAVTSTVTPTPVTTTSIVTTTTTPAQVTSTASTTAVAEPVTSKSTAPAARSTTVIPTTVHVAGEPTVIPGEPTTVTAAAPTVTEIPAPVTVVGEPTVITAAPSTVFAQPEPTTVVASPTTVIVPAEPTTIVASPTTVTASPQAVETWVTPLAWTIVPILSGIVAVVFSAPLRTFLINQFPVLGPILTPGA